MWFSRDYGYICIEVPLVLGFAFAFLPSVLEDGITDTGTTEGIIVSTGGAFWHLFVYFLLCASLRLASGSRDSFLTFRCLTFSFAAGTNSCLPAVWFFHIAHFPFIHCTCFETHDKDTVECTIRRCWSHLGCYGIKLDANLDVSIPFCSLVFLVFSCCIVFCN